MNQNALRVIYRFNSAENQQGLRRALSDVPVCNMASLIKSFTQRVSNELSTSDPIMSVADQVDCYNKMFVFETRKYFGRPEQPAMYHVTDGDITSRNTHRGY